MRASYAALGDATVPIPDVDVYVLNLLTGVASTKVKTDLHGRYQIPVQPAGWYRLCWQKPGWTSQCGSTLFNVTNDHKFPGLSALVPASSPSTRVRGVVELADGTPCYHEDEFFGIEHTAHVSLYGSTGNLLQRVRANSSGEFVLTQLPKDGSIDITCGDSKAKFSIRGQEIDLSGGQAWEVILPNHRPEIRGIDAFDGSGAAERVAPQTLVDLAADAADADADTLTYEWKVQDAAGALSTTAGPHTQWSLPKSEGTYYAYLTVHDGQGGYAHRRVSVRVRDDANLDVTFSGIVRDEAGMPIEGAIVSVGAASTKTGARGEFGLTAKEADAYVLNVTRIGYADYSRRVLKPSRGQTYVLTGAYRQAIDPWTWNTIIDRRERWMVGVVKDERGKSIRYERVGGRVTIPPNALVDPEGNPPDPNGAPFHAYIATIDPVGETMLGDFSARNSNGADVALFSYGALFIEVRDKYGREYNLAPDAKAEIAIPVQQPILSYEPVPPSIDMWTYEPKKGIWEELPDAGTFAGNAFVTQVGSFSTKNADVEKTSPACIRIQLDSLLPTDGSLHARVDVTVSPGSVRRYELVLDDENNVLYNLPENAPYVVEVFDGAPPAGTLKATLPGNTGGPWGGTGVPPYPYAACDTQFLEASLPSGSVPFLTFKGTGSVADAAAYYAAIDPLGLRATLGDFWSQNGFAADGSGGTRTSFINHNDLGFGRDMHCRENGSEVACYVTNYGEPDQAPGNFTLAQTANPAEAVATVAMEYSPVEGEDPSRFIVKFYAYLGGDSTGPFIDSADLDKAGPKFLPHLCLNCHGGDYPGGSTPTIDDVDMGSSFREFDVYSFRDASGLNPDVADGLADVLAQEPNFLLQNGMVVNSDPAQAIVDLIDAFYDNGALANIDPNAMPAGWEQATTGAASTESLYLDVAGKACRTCHVALSPSIDWNSYAEFRDARNVIHAYACNLKFMPHANITFKNFWLSDGPHRPDELANYTGPGWLAPLGSCDP